MKVLDGTDVELAAGLCGFKLANAAELMRATYPAWALADVVRSQRMLRDIFIGEVASGETTTTTKK